MVNIKSIIKSRKSRDFIINRLDFLPDKLYISLFYFSVFNKFPNLSNPIGFNEKLNWLKLHDIHPEYKDLVDKIKVREYIENALGPGHLFPILGKWKTFDDIDFDTLPNEFVLKCNHDSGSVRIIKDKSSLSESEILKMKKFFDERMSHDFFYAGREYPYKGIERYIFAEELMKSENNGGINDYKFFCFNGNPEIMFVATERDVDCKFDFFDMDFNHLNIYNIHPNSNKSLPKPKKFEEMKRLASQLSQGIKFVRIDFYEIDDKIYFGEFTFFHAGGFSYFKPDEWERKLGDLIDISIK